VVGAVMFNETTPALSVAVDQIIPSVSDLARLVQSVCGGRSEREPATEVRPAPALDGVFQK
jgi:hypothetical protein